MAISAAIKQANAGDHPRNLMQISNYKIQNEQLQGKSARYFPQLALFVLTFLNILFKSISQVTVSVMLCIYLISVVQVLHK